MILINASTRKGKRIFESFMPHGIPLGLASLYAVLKRSGKEAFLFDEQMIGDSFPHITSQFPDRHFPYVFGISVLTDSYRRSLDLASSLKTRYPNSKIVFGGVHASALPEEVLANEQVDVVARGEMENHIAVLQEALAESKPLTDILNLSYRLNGAIVHTPRDTARVDLNTLPPIPYDLFTDPRYNLGVVMSSRGCPHHCIFCSNRLITDARYRFKNANLVADEIEFLYRKYHQTYILFVDDSLTVNKTRVHALLDELERRSLVGKIKYGFQTRADYVDEDMLKALYAHGFRDVAFGIETGSERLMKMIQKGETVQQCSKAIKLAKAIGFQVSGTFIFGLPTETHEDRMEGVRVAKMSGINKARFNNATPYPATELYKMAKADGGLHILGCYENFLTVSAIAESPFSRIPFSYLAPGTTEREIRNDIIFAYASVYLNVQRLKAILSGMSKERKRSANTGNVFWQKIARILDLCNLSAMLAIKLVGFVFNFALRRDCAVTTKDIKLLFLKAGECI